MKESELMRLVSRNLGIWQTTGVILWYSRLQSFKIKHFGNWIQGCVKGTPDWVVAFRNKEDNIGLLFLEVKGENGYLRPEQREFMNAHKNQKDVHCHVIREQLEISHLLNTLGIDLIHQLPEDAQCQ